MRRLSLLIALISAALAVATPDALAVTGGVRAYSLCGTSCASFWAHGRGTVTQTAVGVTSGSLSGTITIRDRDGGHDFSVSNWASRKTLSDGSQLFKGSNLHFLATTSFRVKLVGQNISVSTVARGQATVIGTGQYTLNGPTAYAWTQQGRTLTLRK